MQCERISKSNVLFVRSIGKSTQKLIEDLEKHGFSVTHVARADQAVVEAATQEFPLILFDLAKSASYQTTRIATLIEVGKKSEPTTNEGLEALRKIRRLSPASQVVVLVDKDLDLATCCRAVTYGAASFVEWTEAAPVDRIVDRLKQAYGRYQAVIQEGRELHSRRIFDETGVTGQSQIMAKLLFQAKRAAIISDAPVLIYGESGTGKQLLAEAIHRMDPKRKNKPFLTVNCAAITGSLAESALFGHRKGAFTGAAEDRSGYFRAADGGTILLDEISELEKTLQPKLLRVLQDGCILPVGDDIEQTINVRVIASCNRPLPVLVEKGEFRLDLYQRLNVIALEIPPLRDHPEDIPLLVQFFLRRYASYYPRPITSVDERVYQVLAQSIGSGNVRELENAVRRILTFKKAGNCIELSDIPPGLLEKQAANRAEAEITESLTSAVVAMIHSGRITITEMLEEFEETVLREALSRSTVSYTELARQLGLSRRTFYNKLRKYKLTKSP